MAQLIDWLAFAGARTSGGTVVSSGAAWFYVAGGGTTLATVYSDVDGTIVATNPVALDAGGRASVYVTAPVRIAIQDSAGADVMDEDQADVSRAEAVQVDNTGWSDSYLDSVLTKLYTSVGGVDGQYQESSGATVRTVKSKFSELSISVKDFGAKGDGLTIDTTSVQAAINRVGFLGGGEVYFPPGTYLIDVGLVNAVSGVSFRGPGSTLKYTATTGSLLTVTGASNWTIRGLMLTCSSTSTGSALSIAGGSAIGISAITASLFRTCISTSASASQLSVSTSFLFPIAADSAGRGLALTDTAGVCVTGVTCAVITAGYCIEALGSTGAVEVTGCSLVGLLGGGGVKFNSALTGTGFTFAGNYLSAVPAFTFAGATMPGVFHQSGNGVDGYKAGLLTGATFTPDLSKGYSITADATTTGSAYTVAVPTPPPAATDYGVYLKLTLYCHAGGSITGWGMAAGYHTSSGPSTTDTHRTTYLFNWDPDNSVWREVSRSDTT